jgi:hypothetical protein
MFLNHSKVKDLVVSWDLIGNCNLLIKVINKETNRRIVETSIMGESEYRFKSINLDVGYYVIEFYSIEENFFGKVETEHLYSEDLCLGEALIIDSQRFCLRGSEAICYDGTFTKVNNLYLKNLREVNPNKYEGDTYLKINGNFVYCKSFNPVKLNLEKSGENYFSFYIRDFKNEIINLNKKYEINKVHFRVDRNEH